MTYYSDAYRQPFQSLSITYQGEELLPFVVWAETNFLRNGAAQPGSATVVLRDPKKQLDLVEGGVLRAKVNGQYTWTGYGVAIDKGYFFEDYAERRWTIHGIDLNILFDRLHIYNHADPRLFPDNAGQWPGGNIPTGTTDKELLLAYLADSDIGLITPAISPNLISETTIIAPAPRPKDGYVLMEAGKALRAGFDDVSANANKTAQGSYVYYIDADAFIVYQRQDSFSAPWSVGEGGQISCRALTITHDISQIKNDVLLFANSLNPLDKATKFAFRHNSLTASIQKYGLWQYSEVVDGFLAQTLQARSEKILVQEGTPAVRADFTIFVPGLDPGMIVEVIATVNGEDVNVPVRSVEMTFPVPYMAAFHAVCSFDTNDPYGLLLALKRPAPRGIIPARFQTITWDANQVVPALPTYTYVREIPGLIGSVDGQRLYQLSYAYIRFSIAVHAGGLRALSVLAQPNNTLEFNEYDPDLGQFTMSGGGSDPTIFAEYHIAHGL